MKNIVVILAGGVGRRMGMDMPKQFMIVKERPIIVHTITNFQKNDRIDAILIVCVKEWIAYLQDMISEYQLTKVQWIIEGGDTVHDSTRNAVFYLRTILKDNDCVIIHDAARPILPQAAINELLDTAPSIIHCTFVS